MIDVSKDMTLRGLSFIWVPFELLLFSTSSLAVEKCWFAQILSQKDWMSQSCLQDFV